MPYEWLPASPAESRLHIWPYRSVQKRGFVWFIGVTAALTAVLMLGVLGSPVLWAFLPFTLGAVWTGRIAQHKYSRDREIIKDLPLSPDRITWAPFRPKGRRQDWATNPYWVCMVNAPQVFLSGRRMEDARKTWGRPAKPSLANGLTPRTLGRSVPYPNRPFTSAPTAPKSIWPV